MRSDSVSNGLTRQAWTRAPSNCLLPPSSGQNAKYRENHRGASTENSSTEKGKAENATKQAQI